MKLDDEFDIPEEISRGPHSPTFAKFLRNWFGDTSALTHGELDLTFLDELTPEELDLARQMVRRNLKLRYTHIIEGASALHDVDAAPMLRAMLEDEPNESRRLTIAGALWKLNRDPIFFDYLNQAKGPNRSLLSGAHLNQILWVGDERAIDLLIDLLDNKDEFIRFQALSLLNCLEFCRRFFVPKRELQRQPEDYRRRKLDPAFRAFMTAAVRRWNGETKNGS